MKSMAPLGLLSEGEKAEIVEIRTQKRKALSVERGAHNAQLTTHNAICHAEDMGLHVGKVIEMLNNKGRGPLLLKVDESRIAIGRGLAMKIMVRRLD
jgi:ferrous iron transport protein A